MTSALSISQRDTHDHVAKTDNTTKDKAYAGTHRSIQGTTPLPLLAVIEVTVANGARKTRTKLHITKGKTGTLLGCHTSVVLGMVFFARQVHEAQVEAITKEFPLQTGPT